jgi:transcription elongation factor Elf1
MKPCSRCKKNNWNYATGGKLIGEDKRDKFIVATCRHCGLSFDFAHRINKLKKVEACYKIKDRKHYLKIGRKYVEVYLKYFKNGDMRVMPVGE